MIKKCQNHLRSVDEGYFRHLCFAARIGVRLIGAGIAVLLHGVFPAVFQYTASRTIYRLHDDMTARLQKTGVKDIHHG